MDTCDHSKQGLESENAPETQHDPDSEVTDDCDPSKSALDEDEVSHENFDMDANDSSKQGSEPNQSSKSMRTHGRKFGVKTRPQIFFAQNLIFFNGSMISDFREMRENLLQQPISSMAFRFLQRLSNFFNGCQNIHILNILIFRSELRNSRVKIFRH